MKEKFGMACRFIGALVFSLALMSVPITATSLKIYGTYPIVCIVFEIVTFIEFLSLGFVLFTITNANDEQKTRFKGGK